MLAISSRLMAVTSFGCSTRIATGQGNRRGFGQLSSRENLIRGVDGVAIKKGTQLGPFIQVQGRDLTPEPREEVLAMFPVEE